MPSSAVFFFLAVLSLDFCAVFFYIYITHEFVFTFILLMLYSAQGILPTSGRKCMLAQQPEITCLDGVNYYHPACALCTSKDVGYEDLSYGTNSSHPFR